MAKQPDDSRRPHPDDNPQTTPPAKSEHPQNDPDSSVDLSNLDEGEVSGISVIEWATIEEPQQGKQTEQAPLDEADIARLLHESDHPALGKPASHHGGPAAAEDEALYADMMAGGTSQGPSAVPEPPGEEPSGVDVDFEESRARAERSAADSGSFVDLGGRPRVDEDWGTGRAKGQAPESSIINLGHSAIVSQAASAPESSIIDLGHSAILSEEAVNFGGEIVVGESDAIDLGADAIVVEEHVPAVTPSEVIDLGPDAIIVEPPADGGGVDLASPVVLPRSAGDSGAAIDLSADDLILEEDGNDAIDLTHASAATEVPGDSVVPLDFLERRKPDERAGLSDDDGIDLGPDSALVEEASDSTSGAPAGIDLAAPTAAEGSDVDLLAEDILLEQPASGSGVSASARDLIAEGLESGQDLLGSRKGAPHHEEDEAIDDFLAETAMTEDSSSVDLGSSPDLVLFNEAQRANKVPAEPADTNIRIDEVEEQELPVHEGDYEDIDLDQIEEPVRKPARAKKSAADTAEIDALAAAEMSESPADEEAPVARKGKGKAKPVEEDEAEAEPEEVAPKKKRARASDDEAAPAKKGGKAGAWMGGTLLGTLVGAGACVGLIFAGLIPMDWLGQSSPPARPQGQGQNGGLAQPIPQQQQVTFGRTVEQIRNGDLDQVKPEDLAKADEGKPEELVARAEYNWLSYLKAERGKNPQAPLAADAAPVKNALADLDKAVAGASAEAKADALFLRGQIHQLTGNRAAAQADYEAGEKQFAAQPAQKARFENAILLMGLTGQARLLPPGFSREMLVALLVNLQAGDARPAPAQPDEAGYLFWQALKQARAGKSTDAVKLLDEARARHDQRRYLLPNKPQNPNSDPREDIFLKACDELRAYWAYQSRLNNPNYLEADAKDRIPAVDKLLDRVGDAARAEQLKALGKLFKDKPIAKADDVVALVEAERKAADAEKAKLDAQLVDQQKKLDTVSSDIKLAEKRADTAEKALKDTQAVAKKAQADSEAAQAVLKQVGETVGSEFTDVKTSRDSLLREVRETVRTAKTVDSRGTIKQLERDLAADRGKLAQRWEPAEMLNVWMPLLQDERDRKDLNDRASQDVRRVLADPASKDEAKARALMVQGLVQRNAEKFAEAKDSLSKARPGLLGSKGDWLAQTDRALAEVSDPAADFAKKAKLLSAEGKSGEAIAVLERGIKTLPDRKGALLVQRAKTSFEAARSKGPLKGNDPVVQSAQKDAEAAAAEGLPEGYYLAGRVAEELGQYGEAVKNFRAAVKAHGKNDAEGSRYRIALARALLQQGSAPAGSSRLESVRPDALALERKAGRRALTLDALSVLSLLALQVGDLPGEKPATTTEAEKLADEVLALGDKAPFDARAQAYAIKGLHTRALIVYTAGLRDKNLLDAEHANTLLALINNHPILRRPETLTTADPTQGARFYSSGLNFFFSRKYPSAEKEFLSAIENDKADARYYYFLGLARLAQGKREGYEDFDQGARLEQQGKPDRGTVSTALERVQGRLRSALNEVRSRPVREAAK